MNESKIENGQPTLQQHNVSCWAFNLNEYIKVKIYDKGYQVLADNHNKYLGVIKNWEKRDAEYYKLKADENGYTRFQAWNFIEEFGSVTRLGMNGYYSTEIQIEGKYLSPCS